MPRQQYPQWYLDQSLPPPPSAEEPTLAPGPTPGGGPFRYPNTNISPNESMLPNPPMGASNIPTNEGMLPDFQGGFSAPFTNVPPNEWMDYPTSISQSAQAGGTTTMPGDIWGADWSGGLPGGTPYPVQVMQFPDTTNPVPGEEMLPTGVASAPTNVPPGEDMLPAPNDTYYLPHENGYHVVTNGQVTGSIPASPAPQPGTGLPESTASADLGGWGQPMGYFPWAGQQPIGNFGIPNTGMWASGDLAGIYSGPLPGANIPSYFGNSGLTLGSGGGRTGQGIYGWASGSGGGAGGHASVPTGVQ